jgi:glutathione S-transferase
VNPEDKVVNKGELAEQEHDDVLRIKRAHINALENAVPFFVIGALYVATGATKTGAQLYCYTFLAARLLHSVFYLAGKQPFRTLSFGVGALANLGMAYHVIRAVL